MMELLAIAICLTATAAMSSGIYGFIISTRLSSHLRSTNHDSWSTFSPRDSFNAWKYINSMKDNEDAIVRAFKDTIRRSVNIAMGLAFTTLCLCVGILVLAGTRNK